MDVGSSYAARARSPAVRTPPRLAQALGWGALVALVLWAAAPLVLLLVRAAGHHESLSGGDSLFAADQLQYLAWIRSSGEHVLAADDFSLRTGGAVFVDPMFLISGALWRAGTNIALSYLIWLPVTIGVLFAGFRQFCFRTLGTPMARAGGLILALFFVTPVDPLAHWTTGSGDVAVLAGQLAPTSTVFGYLPAGIAIGLLALVMLGLDRILDSERRGGAWSLGWTSAGALAVSWLHPWQGATLLVVIAALLLLRRLRRSDARLLLPMVAAALPLVYYAVLPRVDGGWKIAQLQSAPDRPSVVLLVAALAPLLAFAGLGVRRGRRYDVLDSVLWVWPSAAIVVYFASPGYAAHALEGISLPLAVLAVRGWQRLRWPPVLAVLAIAISTAPGLARALQQFRDVSVSDPQGLLLRSDESRALGYLERAPTRGGVLPSLRLSAAVPAYTGRRTWAGHASWTPDFAARAAAITDLMSGRLSGAAARDLVRRAGARYLLADCEPGFRPEELRPLVVSVHRFGCVSVYELQVRDRSAPL